MGWELKGALAAAVNLPAAYGKDQYDLEQLEDQTRALVLQRNREAETRSKKVQVYNETWANRNGWNGTGTVSGGKYHASGAANAAIVRAIDLKPGEHMAMRFKYRHHNVTGSYVLLGFTNTPLGVAPTGGNDTKGIYYGTANNNGMGKFRGSELAGTDPPHITGGLPAGDYLITVVVDEDWISWALTGPDYQAASDFAYLRVRRSAMPGGPTLNNIVVSVGGTASTETQFALHQGQIVRGAMSLDWDSLDTALDDVPVQYQIEDDTTSIRWSVQTPRKQKDSVPAPVVLFMHGAGENGRQPWTDAKTLTLTKALEAAGYIVCSSDNGTSESGGALTDVNKFGNQASMDDYAKLVNYVRAHHSTGPVMLLGESMGTFSGLNLLQFRQLGGIAAFVSICGQPDLSFAYADPTWKPEVTAAHAYPTATTQAAWDDLMKVYNPRQQPGYEFRGVGIKFYVADDDATANPALPGIWAAENAGWFDFEEYHTPSGGHMSAGAYQPADLVAFYNKHRTRWWIDDSEVRQPILTANKPDLVSGIQFPLYIAHRGGHLIHGEHSMDSYEWSASQGYGIECDVQVLADGGLACCHDATTTRTMVQIEGTTQSTVNLITTRDWMKNYRILPEIAGADYERPTVLPEVLDKFGGRVLITPEVKVTAARVPVCNEIVKRGLERAVLLQSFDLADVTYALSRGIEGVYLNPTETASVLVGYGLKYVGVPSSATTAYLDSLVAAGLKVIIYTVNKKVDADALLTANRAHGFFSDDPDHISGRGVKSYSDPFRSRIPPVHMVTPTNYFRENLIFKGGGIGQRIVTTGNNTTGFLCDWCPPIKSGKANIYFEVEFGEVATSQTRWVGLFFGTTPNADDPFTDGTAVVGQVGWHALARRDGGLDIYAVVSNAAPGSASASYVGTTGTVAAAAGRVTTHQFRFTRSATAVSLTNLTLNTTVTFNNATLQTNAKFQFNFNGTEATVRSVRVEEIP